MREPMTRSDRTRCPDCEKKNAVIRKMAKHISDIEHEIYFVPLSGSDSINEVTERFTKQEEKDA